jgi:hypothetical protein
MIKPTVGRKVWYRHDNAPISLGGGHFLRPAQISDQPMDATVVYVWDDRMVNLHVMDHHGNSFNRTSVKLLQDGDVPPMGSGYAEWMPYQQGQAKAAGEAPVVAQDASVQLVGVEMSGEA